MNSTRHAVIQTGLGDLTVVAVDEALTGVFFPGHWHLPPPEFYGEAVLGADDPVIEHTRSELEEYLAGERTAFSVPLATSGDAFSERVWALLKDIPYGETTSYGELAGALGNRRLAQRVGQCVGRNPISVLIPCHRVLGADGSLTGYAGGLERKRRLLDLEEPAAAASSRLF